MTPFWFCVLLFVVMIASVGFVFAFDEGVVVTVLVGGVCFFTIAVILPVTYLSRHFGRISCAEFAQQTGRETRFVIYNDWSLGDCLTPTDDGKWISTSALREFGERP